MSLLMEVLDGIKIYFDFMLKDHLLYSEEKKQYDHFIPSLLSAAAAISNCTTINNNSQEEISNNLVMPSSIYGATHLLRLFGE